MTPIRFVQRLRVAPTKPGVYMMKDRKDGILYVGKASNIKARLSSYFGSSTTHTPKIERMLSHLFDFDFTVTSSASEALMLENTLIKKHRPKFNVRLKDDKTYPYIKIDKREAFPQIYITRQLQNDSATYFGPFSDARSVRRTVALLKKLFRYRSCTKEISGKAPRACLEYYINLCDAPCIGAISQQDYHNIIDQIILFMQGNTKPILSDLEEHMKLASANLHFEKAAILRDQIKAIKQIVEEQSISFPQGQEHGIDAIGMVSVNDHACMGVLSIRNGRLIGIETFIMDNTQFETPEILMESFLQQFYLSLSTPPKKILLQNSPVNQNGIKDWFQETHNKVIHLATPKRGKNLHLIKLAQENARQRLTQFIAKWWANTNTVKDSLYELQEQLNLPVLPSRIECYDISNIQGTHPTGSMVIFQDGIPEPKSYRRFKIKSISTIDDYAMMREILTRRFQRVAKSHPNKNALVTDNDRTVHNKWSILPNLVIIDGGKGHLSSALEVLLNLGLDFIPIASIAKQNEWIYVPQTPEAIILSKRCQSLKLVQRIRDEAHRFAITYHRNLRNRSALASSLDLVSGLGPKRKRNLIRKFRSVIGVKKASLEQLASTPGISDSLALRIRQTL